LQSAVPEITFRKFVPTKSKPSVSKRVGWVATPLAKAGAAARNGTLRRLDLTNTGIDAKGLELAVTMFKALRILAADDALWCGRANCLS